MEREFPEKYHNYRSDSRNRYWSEPPSYLPGVYPGGGLPNHQEKLRKEMVVKEGSSLSHSLSSYSPYLSRSMNSRGRTRPLDTRRLTTDFRVQDWASPVGVRRNLPTNVPGAPTSINVNSIRFERDVNYTGNLPCDGGTMYSNDVCVSNWVEERRDKSYVPSFPPRDARRTGDSLYPTEYSQRFCPNSDAYRDKLATLYSLDGSGRRTTSAAASTGRGIGTGTSSPMAKTSPSSFFSSSLSSSTPAEAVAAAKQKGKGNESHLMGYMADGFGETPFQDHTTEPKRGGFWVGAAPHKMYESVTATMGRRERLEFQKRCVSEDPRSKILMKTRPLTDVTPKTLQIREKMMQTQQRYTDGNRSIYGSDFKDFTAAARASASAGLRQTATA